MGNTLTNKVVREIALKNFGHTLDCAMGYSDAGYSLQSKWDEFEQNFAEDLEERGFVVNNIRLQRIGKVYETMVKRFEAHIRKKYKNIYTT